MTKEEVDKFVDNLPELGRLRFRTGIGYDDRYMYVFREEGKLHYTYLLNTGELVDGTYRTDSKTLLKRKMRDGATYVGIGILHIYI